jgi:hypothetical protein
VKQNGRTRWCGKDLGLDFPAYELRVESRDGLIHRNGRREGHQGRHLSWQVKQSGGSAGHLRSM